MQLEVNAVDCGEVSEPLREAASADQNVRHSMETT